QLETLEQTLSTLSVEVQPVPTEVSQASTTTESDNESSDWWARIQALPEQTADFLQSDMKGLVRIEDVRSDVAIMSNEQLAVVKERMKLEVAMLKHALISHRPSLWDRTIQSLNGMLDQYFSNEQANVKGVKSQLDDLSKVSIHFEVKAFEQTLDVIRQTQAELGKE
nr:uroporphyrinogen-III C-methyltransferase [Alcaligenaceae bacterium]